MTVPEPPSRHRPMPRALEQLILRCIDKDPAQRPQSAEELGQGAGGGAADGRRARADRGGRSGRGRAGRRGRGGRRAGTRTPIGHTEGHAGAAARADGERSDDAARPASRRPLVWVGAAAARRAGRRGDRAGRAPRRRRQGGAGDGRRRAAAARRHDRRKPMPGRAHVVVKGADDARVLRDVQVWLTAASWRRGPRGARSGPRAGRIARAARRGRRSRRPTSGRSRSPSGTEAELEVSLAPTAPPAVEPHTGAPRTPGTTTRRAAKVGAAPASPTTPPAPSKTRHRDGLVGDDIFDGK